MSNELVSIIVRTKDRALLLEHALHSIAAQTYRPLEVVLVNDGGCGLDPVRLGGLLGDVSLTYVPLAENHGRAHAANVGIGNAKGELISFLDDDDLYYPDGLVSLVTAQCGNGPMVLYGKVLCRTYGASGTPIDEGTALASPFDRGRLLFENYIPTNSLLVPAACFNMAGPFDTEFEIYEDWDYLIRLASLYDFKFVDALVGEYRIFETATITGKGGSSLQTRYKQKIFTKHLDKARAHDFIEYVQGVVDRIVLEKEEHIHRLSFFIKERDVEIERLREGVAWLKDNVTSRDTEIERLKEAVASRDAEIERLKEAAASRDAEIERLGGLLSAITTSRSWRITKPLRSLGVFTRRLVYRTDEGTRTVG